MPTVTNTLEERGSRYGRFADHAAIAQGIQDVMRAAPNWDKLDLDMKQALSVMADKFARILNGDPFYADNWHDIQGYAKLIEDRINMLDSEEQGLLDTEVRIEVDESKLDPNILDEIRRHFRNDISYYQAPPEIRRASGYVDPNQTFMIDAGFNGA